MPWTAEHMNWLTDTGKRITTADGKTVEVWEFNNEPNELILSAWARHFRNHYCLDNDIDFLRGGLSRKDYLNNIKFPTKAKNESPLGPITRAGDFAEILIADYLQYHLGFWVPRVRWSSKVIRNESAKGSDVIGFYFYENRDSHSVNDILIVFESKTSFSKKKQKRLQDAINSSAKDHLRLAESLHYIKQKFYEKGRINEALRVERFQNPVDILYKLKYGAAAVFSNNCFDQSDIASADCCKIPKSSKPEDGFVTHPNINNLILLTIKGPDMMNLVHELYRRAADEA